MKLRLLRPFAGGLTLATAAALASTPAEACGGFFCSQQQPVNQAAERIIFADNGDGTITAVIQILYEGPSENFSWLLPISTVPNGDELALASDLAFQRLQLATNPQYNLTTRVEGTCRSPSSNTSRGDSIAVPRETCGDNALLAGCGVLVPDDPAAVNVEASGTVGAFEWTVLSVDPALAKPADATLEWLTNNGYDVTPGANALIAPYLMDGMYLLALRLTKGSDTGAIRPIQLTYAAAAPMIPIKLTAVAANEDMGVMTWALANARAVPFNYSALELNEARINWFNAAANYNQVVTEAANDSGGQGFVTEFAGPSAQLANVIWQESDESSWQGLQNGTYSSFSQIFERLYSQYQAWDGFWEATRKAVTLPTGISFENFRLCPGCYAKDVSFLPTELLAAVEADVIEPMRSVQRLIDRNSYATRLYSTLSASDMILDPVFVFNPDLPDVNNVHQAERVTECSQAFLEFEAPWRIDFPQGTVIRGTPQDVGQWPTEVDQQPANFRVVSLAASGEGVVVADNGEVINQLLGDYNAAVVPVGTDLMQSGGGACALSPLGRYGRRAPAALGAGLWGLLGLALLRRRAKG